MADDTHGLTITQSEEITGIGGWALFNPHRRPHRYLALFFICFLSFGSYFCYDNPAALANVIQKDMDVTASQYLLLYSLYSWPNTVLCFFGGYLLDRVFGVRFGTLIFSSFCIVGQAVFALGAFGGPSTYWVMEVGRFIFGLGGESLAVAQNTYSVMWFKGSELNMVFGLQLSFSRVGSTVNMNVMQPIYDLFVSGGDNSDCVDLGFTLLVGVGLCLYSFMCGVILLFIDKRAARILKRQEDIPTDSEPIKLTDVRYFPLSFWLICIICVMYYSAIFPFIAVGKIFFIGKFGLSDSSASLVDSIVYLISAGASPFFGFMVDQTGRNLIYLLVAVVGSLCSHFLLAYTWLNPWFAMILMGITYSLCACALWPMVAIIIPSNQLGTAYGIMQSIQNLGLALSTIIVGSIVDASGYLMLEIFFIVCMFIALIATSVLILMDDYNGDGLNLSAARRREIAAEVEEAAEKHNIQEVAGESDEDANKERLAEVMKPRSASALRQRLYSVVTPEAAEDELRRSRTLSINQSSLHRRSIVA